MGEVAVYKDNARALQAVSSRCVCVGEKSSLTLSSHIWKGGSQGPALSSGVKDECLHWASEPGHLFSCSFPKFSPGYSHQYSGFHVVIYLPHCLYITLVGWPTISVCLGLRGVPWYRTFRAKTGKTLSKLGPLGHPEHWFKLWSDEWHPKPLKQVIIITVIKHEDYRTFETCKNIWSHP